LLIEPKMKDYLGLRRKERLNQNGRPSIRTLSVLHKLKTSRTDETYNSCLFQLAITGGMEFDGQIARHGLLNPVRIARARKMTTLSVLHELRTAETYSSCLFQLAITPTYTQSQSHVPTSNQLCPHNYPKSKSRSNLQSPPHPQKAHSVK